MFWKLKNHPTTWKEDITHYYFKTIQDYLKDASSRLLQVVQDNTTSNQLYTLVCGWSDHTICISLGRALLKYGWAGVVVQSRRGCCHTGYKDSWKGYNCGSPCTHNDTIIGDVKKYIFHDFTRSFEYLVLLLLMWELQPDFKSISRLIKGYLILY